VWLVSRYLCSVGCFKAYSIRFENDFGEENETYNMGEVVLQMRQYFWCASPIPTFDRSLRLQKGKKNCGRWVVEKWLMVFNQCFQWFWRGLKHFNFFLKNPCAKLELIYSVFALSEQHWLKRDQRESGVNQDLKSLSSRVCGSKSALRVFCPLNWEMFLVC